MRNEIRKRKTKRRGLNRREKVTYTSLNSSKLVAGVKTSNRPITWRQRERQRGQEVVTVLCDRLQMNNNTVFNNFTISFTIKKLNVEKDVKVKVNKWLIGLDVILFHTISSLNWFHGACTPFPPRYTAQVQGLKYLVTYTWISLPPPPPVLVTKRLNHINGVNDNHSRYDFRGSSR